jgi:hypothetical protein
VHQKLARDLEPLVDPEAPVEMRVVDEAFPADGRARLFEVHAHRDQEIADEALLDLEQPRAILTCRRDVVDRARTDDDDEPVLRAMQDAVDFVARIRNGVRGIERDGKLAQQNGRRDQLFDRANAHIVRSVLRRIVDRFHPQNYRPMCSASISRRAALCAAGLAHRSRVGT